MCAAGGRGCTPGISRTNNGRDSRGRLSPHFLQSVHLPNVAGVLRYHRLSRLTSPSLLELGHVLHHAVDTILSRRVWIGGDLHASVFGTPFFAPHPTESQKETLLGCVAVDLLAFPAGLVVGNHVLERPQGDARAAVVRCVFSESEAAIQLEVVHRNEVGIFVGDATAALLKLFAAPLRPPIWTFAGG